MPAPYSYDLRQKAIDAVKRGEPKIEVCRMLKISRNTLDLWLQRAEQTGDCRAITRYQKGNRHKITDWKRFREASPAAWREDAGADGFVVGGQRNTAGH